MKLQKKDINICKKIHKKHGKSYYFATKLFPKDIREATYVLYAFFRIPDEIVDNPNVSNDQEIKLKLEAWRIKWQKCYREMHSDEPVLRATAIVFKKYNIPYEYSESFLSAMIQDTEVKRYENYKELEYYMYGSAAVVGLMMSYVIGFSNPKALEYAKKLGYAMQMTNFLRDIREDYEQRSRIYMPEDELDRYEVNEKMIAKHEVSKEFIQFMKYQIKKVRKLYEEAEEGISLLHPKGQFAVRAASALYGAILTKIEENKYDIYSKRVGTTFFEKLKLLWKIW